MLIVFSRLVFLRYWGQGVTCEAREVGRRHMAKNSNRALRRKQMTDKNREVDDMKNPSVAKNFSKNQKQIDEWASVNFRIAFFLFFFKRVCGISET